MESSFRSSLVTKLLTRLFFISSCWTQNEENKIQILNLYVNIQMTYSARKAVLNNKNFCTDSHCIMYKSLHQTLWKGDWMFFPRCIKLFWMTQPWNLLRSVNGKWFFITFLHFSSQETNSQVYLLIIILFLWPP